MDVLPHRAAIWRDLDKLGKWTKRHLKKFSKGKCQVVPLGRNSSLLQNMMGLPGRGAALLGRPRESWQ